MSVQTTRKTKFIKDNVLPEFRLGDLRQRVVDTPLFQRLRNIKQLGFTYRVYPPANHPRFQHSLQVGEVTRKWLTHLQRIHPDNPHLTDRNIEVCGLGGDLHDVGHSLNHSTDHVLCKHFNIPEHEVRTEQLVRHMCKDILTEQEINLVVNIIYGTPIDGYPKWMFQIVANHNSELDVDKIMYLRLDALNTGRCVDIDIDRIISHSRIVDDTLCFNSKLYESIERIFIARYHFFKSVYSHHAVLCVDRMMQDVILLLDPIMHWKELFSDPDMKWTRLNDGLFDNLYLLENDNLSLLQKSSLSKAQAIMSRIQYRNFYKYERVHRFVTDAEKKEWEDLNQVHFCQNCQQTVDMKLLFNQTFASESIISSSSSETCKDVPYEIPDHHIQYVSYSLCGGPNKKIDPMKHIPFYSTVINNKTGTIEYRKHLREPNQIYSSIINPTGTCETEIVIFCTLQKQEQIN